MANFLIVDDSSFIRFAIRKYLEKFGHQILGEAGSGETAIQLYKELQPDIVMLDIVLQGEMSGLEVLKKIIDSYPFAKIIMCSSESYIGTIVKATNLGAKGFIVKPVDGKILIDLVNKII